MTTASPEKRFAIYAALMRQRGENYGPRYQEWAERMASRLARETRKDSAPNGKRQ